MDTAHWPQGIGIIKTMEASRAAVSADQRKTRPQKDQALNCPRCNSTNTKFCYYNNYSLSQPRYFCKTCRRYWTEGGSLRNVPVGGGSRKHSKRSAAAANSSLVSQTVTDHIPCTATPSFLQPIASSNPNTNHHLPEGHDLNLSYPQTGDHYRNFTRFMDIVVPYSAGEKGQNQNPNSVPSTGTGSRGLNSFFPMPVSDATAVFSTGFPVPEFKPSLNFSLLDGFGSSYDDLPEVQERSAARLLFPMEDLKQMPSNSGLERNREQGESGGGYWSGMLSGGTW